MMRQATRHPRLEYFAHFQVYAWLFLRLAFRIFATAADAAAAGASDIFAALAGAAPPSFTQSLSPDFATPPRLPSAPPPPRSRYAARACCLHDIFDALQPGTSIFASARSNRNQFTRTS